MTIERHSFLQGAAMNLFKKLSPVAAFILIFSSNAMSGVKVYLGPTSEILYIQEAPELGENAYLVKFTGVSSPWADKAFKTKMKKA